MLNKIIVGNHVCSIYQTKEQQFSLVIPFIMEGLNGNCKCVYATDDNSHEEIIGVFENFGFSIRKYIDSKQLLLLTKKETYLRDNLFDPDAMVKLIKNLEHDALLEGYVGLRGTGEMTWMLHEASATDKKLIEYEAKLNTSVPKSTTSVICQYNETKFSQDLLVNIIRTHPYVILYGKLYENKYFYTPPQFMTEKVNDFPTTAYKAMVDTIRTE